MTKTIEKMFRGQQVRIIAEGDSITFGAIPNNGGQSPSNYPTILQKKLRQSYANNNIGVLNSGISGRLTQTAVLDFQSRVLGLNPDLVIVMYGINDARDVGFDGKDAVSIQDYKANIDSMIKKCKSANVEVLLLSPTPTLEETTNNNKELFIYNLAAMEVAKFNGIEYIDMHKFMNELFQNEAYIPSEFMPDSIHFTTYEPIANAIASKLIVNFLKINKPSKIHAYKSAYVDTAGNDLYLSPDNKNGSHYITRNGISGSPYATCDFYVDAPNLSMYIETIKFWNCGKIGVLLDGEIVCYINAMSNALDHGVDFLVAENLTIGYHRLELLGTNIESMNNGLDYTNFHLQSIKFK